MIRPIDTVDTVDIQETLSQRTAELFRDQERLLHVRIDRLFYVLMPFQWIFGIICALVITPRTWIGVESSIHIHLLAAIFLGGAITLFPLLLVVRYPGESTTRYVIAISQMLTSALLIHLTGGRIETHFHIFGSLAVLTFYRDWRVLAVATVVTTVDHLTRGFFFPQSVYGVMATSSWRWVEHAGWVVFEDVFLIYACFTSRAEMRAVCARNADLELTNIKIEQQVALRTAELAESHMQLDQQRLKSLSSARLASLGEMAGGMAHEINTPLAVIKLRASQLSRVISMPTIDPEMVKNMANAIESTADRIGKIIHGLRSFSRNSEDDELSEEDLSAIVNDTLDLCSQRLSNQGIDLRVGELLPIKLLCRPAQVSQVLVNLLGNAGDAVGDLTEKWIDLKIVEYPDFFDIRITDSGSGISKEIEQKLFQPFFTTKPVGKGTGLGLSISKGIVESHGGDLFIDRECSNTCFVIRLPKSLKRMTS